MNSKIINDQTNNLRDSFHDYSSQPLELFEKKISTIDEWLKFTDSSNNRNLSDFEDDKSLIIVDVNDYESVVENTPKINYKNKLAEKTLNERYKDKFIRLLRTEDFEYGIKSQSESLIEELIEKDSLVAKNWLSSIYTKYYKNELILAGLLRVISNFGDENQFKIMAMAALVHESDEIKELGVRAFENWVGEESISILENIEVEPGWLKNYINQVIKDLKSN